VPLGKIGLKKDEASLAAGSVLANSEALLRAILHAKECGTPCTGNVRGGGFARVASRSTLSATASIHWFADLGRRPPI